MKQNSPARLTVPLRRKPGSDRGAADFEPISWDEAMALLGDLATSLPDGRNNWTLGSTKPAGDTPAKSGPSPQIGDLRIADTHVQFTDAKLKDLVKRAQETQ